MSCGLCGLGSHRWRSARGFPLSICPPPWTSRRRRPPWPPPRPPWPSPSTYALWQPHPSPSRACPPPLSQPQPPRQPTHEPSPSSRKQPTLLFTTNKHGIVLSPGRCEAVRVRRACAGRGPVSWACVVMRRALERSSVSWSLSFFRSHLSRKRALRKR